LVALLPFAEQRAERHAEMLPQKIEQRRLDGGDENVSRMALSAALYAAMERPTTSGFASSSVCRIGSPPGTSPTPVCPALSFRMTMLRVNSGPCAPLRLSSMLSSPATGMTSISVTVGAPDAARTMSACCKSSSRRLCAPAIAPA
jgi:hypothetical protein